MNDQLYRLAFFGLMNASVFTATYLFGRKAHPVRAAWLSGGGFAAMMPLCYSNGAWIGLLVPLGLSYLYLLRRPAQNAAFQQLYRQYRIFSCVQQSEAVLALVGPKNWTFAQGRIQLSDGTVVPYFFWQGHTTASVSTGRYGSTTVYNHCLAFVFPPGSVNDRFKRYAADAADRSGRSFRQKVKFFFSPDTETPNLATTAGDGSFVLQYDTRLDAACYSRRIRWVEEGVRQSHYSIDHSSKELRYNQNAEPAQ